MKCLPVFMNVIYWQNLYLFRVDDVEEIQYEVTKIKQKSKALTNVNCLTLL